MTELEQKAAFAVQLLKNPNDPFRAALVVVPNDTRFALHIATYWVNDPEVLSFKDDLLKEDGEQAFLPDKAALLRAVWDRAHKPGVDDTDFARLAKLYAEVRGFVEKPGVNINTHTNIDNRVMVVTNMGTVDEWETKLINQQRNLVDVSTSRH